MTARSKAARAARLELAFYARPTAVVARELLGKVISRRLPSGRVQQARIVEVEAYLGPHDAASHARFGPTRRSGILFGPPGRLYVYLIYGMHHCMNVVAEADGEAGAVLIRGAVPLAAGDEGALRGPGKLCAGLGITRADNGLDLTTRTSPIHLLDDGLVAPEVATSARIGVNYAGDWAAEPLRFFVPGAPGVSGPRRPRLPGVRP